MNSPVQGMQTTTEAANSEALSKHNPDMIYQHITTNDVRVRSSNAVCMFVRLCIIVVCAHVRPCSSKKCSTIGFTCTESCLLLLLQQLKQGHDTRSDARMNQHNTIVTPNSLDM